MRLSRLFICCPIFFCCSSIFGIINFVFKKLSLYNLLIVDPSQDQSTTLYNTSKKALSIPSPCFNQTIFESWKYSSLPVYSMVLPIVPEADSRISPLFGYENFDLYSLKSSLSINASGSPPNVPIL